MPPKNPTPKKPPAPKLKASKMVRKPNPAAAVASKVRKPRTASVRSSRNKMV